MRRKILLSFGFKWFFLLCNLFYLHLINIKKTCLRSAVWQITKISLKVVSNLLKFLTHIIGVGVSPSLNLQKAPPLLTKMRPLLIEDAIIPCQPHPNSASGLTPSPPCLHFKIGIVYILRDQSYGLCYTI